MKALTRQARAAGVVRRGRQVRSDRSRAALLAAAAAEFSAQGFAGARTDAIARAAGINKAMLYYHFQSKEDLYEAVIEDHFAEFNQKALQMLEGKGAAREVLLRYVEMHFDFIKERHRYAALFQQMMMGGKLTEKLVPKYFGPRAAALDRLLERGMRSGEFRRADRRHTAVSIVALIVFYFSASQVLRVLQGDDAFSPANLGRRKHEVLAFIEHGLFTGAELKHEDTKTRRREGSRRQ